MSFVEFHLESIFLYGYLEFSKASNSLNDFDTTLLLGILFTWTAYFLFDSSRLNTVRNLIKDLSKA